MTKAFLVLKISFLLARMTLGSFYYDEATMTIPGDFVIAAIFPIRSYGGKDKNFKECGDLEPAFVLQAEAFRLSIEYVNEYILKNYTFGGLVVDECDNAIIGLQSAVRLMTGAISGTGKTDGICKSFTRGGSNKNFTVLYGVTGGTTSVISERVEPLLEVFCLPLISAYATAPDFDDTTTYGYFLRTVPSDIYQAKAVYDVLKHMHWHSVILVYEKTPYGDGMQKMFKQEIERKKSHSDFENSFTDICIAEEISLSNVKPDFDDMYKKIEKSETRVVVVFVDFTTAKMLFQHMKEKHNDTIGKYQFVGADGWGRTEAASGAEEVIENAITTEYFSHEMRLMVDYMKQLTFGQVSNSSNPWLKELINKEFDCDLINGTCGNLTENDLVNLQGTGAGLGRAYYIFEAVYAFAKAFEELRQEYCPPGTGICDDFYKQANGSHLLEALKHVRISEPDQLPYDFTFFNGSNSGPPNYSVFQFQLNPQKNVREWVPIGNWSIEKDEADGNPNIIEKCASNRSFDCVRARSYHVSTPERPECRARCNDRRRRDFTPNRCCWDCIECTAFQYVNRSTTEDTCVECRMGQVPNRHFNTCVPAVPSYPGIDSFTPLFSVFFLLAALGFASALISSGILIWYRRTPSAVLASFPLCVLSTLILAALFASIVLTALKPSDALCLAQWSIQPFLLTSVIGAMFVHVLQMPRYHFGSALTIPKKSCASVRTRQVIQLILICTLEIAVVIFCTIWFRRSGGVNRDSANRHHLSCYVHIERIDESTVIACSTTMTPLNILILFIIPFLLLCICLIFACRRFKSRTVFERRENRRVVWCCGLILLLFIFVATPVFATVKTPVPLAAMQIATVLLCGFMILFFVYAPTVIIMIRGRGNSWLHLTRDVKEDERITSDQLTLTDQVGEGCFCEVRRGTYRRNSKQIVEIAAKMAKTLLTHNSVSPADLTDSLLQEIVILRHLRECEHVVRLYGVCNDAESIILVFEYVNGGSCRQFVPDRRSQLTIVDLTSIGACIADALCFLKEKSIVHRDVKSENCLVQERPTIIQHYGTGSNPIVSRYHAKLADFGVAVEANAGAAGCRRRRLFPERHTAPEGFFGNFSYESDVWSFGVFLWELFTLKQTDNATPYGEIPADRIAQHIIDGNILQKPHVAPVDVYEKIMKQCWELYPSKRIAISKLKQLLLERGRKVSGDPNKGNNANGTSANGLKILHAKSTTPDLVLVETKFRATPSMSVSSDGSIASEPVVKTAKIATSYKTPALTTPAQLQAIDTSMSSLGQSPQPSPMTVETDDDAASAATEESQASSAQHRSGLMQAASKYRGATLMPA